MHTPFNTVDNVQEAEDQTNHDALYYSVAGVLIGATIAICVYHYHHQAMPAYLYQPLVE